MKTGFRNKPGKIGGAVCSPVVCKLNCKIRKKNFFSEYFQQAPEILRILLVEKHLTKSSQAADMYALGMVLYQILYRTEPFKEQTMSRRSK